MSSSHGTRDKCIHKTVQFASTAPDIYEYAPACSCCEDVTKDEIWFDDKFLGDAVKEDLDNIRMDIAYIEMYGDLPEDQTPTYRRGLEVYLNPQQQSEVRDYIQAIIELYQSVAEDKLAAESEDEEEEEEDEVGESSFEATAPFKAQAYEYAKSDEIEAYRIYVVAQLLQLFESKRQQEISASADTQCESKTPEPSTPTTVPCCAHYETEDIQSMLMTKYLHLALDEPPQAVQKYIGPLDSGEATTPPHGKRRRRRKTPARSVSADDMTPPRRRSTRDPKKESRSVSPSPRFPRNISCPAEGPFKRQSTPRVRPDTPRQLRPDEPKRRSANRRPTAATSTYIVEQMKQIFSPLRQQNSPNNSQSPTRKTPLRSLSDMVKRSLSPVRSRSADQFFNKAARSVSPFCRVTKQPRERPEGELSGSTTIVFGSIELAGQ